METVARMISGCDAAITRDAGLSVEAIGASDILRVIVVHGAGHDAVDKDAASEKGILVCNTPGANARSVSELALALALAAARRIPAADRSERGGAHGFRECETFIELSGKTALIIGWAPPAPVLDICSRRHSICGCWSIRHALPISMVSSA